MPGFIEPEETEESPSTLKVGEKEYSQEDLEALVGLGELAKEVEEKQNTKLANVYPEYTKARQELKERDQELEDLKKEKEDWETKPTETVDMDMEAAREAARKMGIVTQDDFNDYMKKEFKTLFNEQMQAKSLVDQARALETDIDGADGRPAFKVEDVLLHMQETGINNPERAYKDKYESELDQWKEQQISKGRKKSMTTLDTGAGEKKPEPVKVTKGNLDSMVSDALHGKI